jgi:hypothetical protein
MQIGLGDGTVVVGSPSFPDFGSSGSTLIVWES